MKNTKIVKLFTLVKEVKETTNVNEVNDLIHENWIVLAVCEKEGKYLFNLGRIDTSKVQSDLI